MTEISVVEVAVGVIRNTQGKILISKRPADVHMGGRWEFPGGKVEVGESVAQALSRELEEELGISIPPDNVGKQSGINTPGSCFSRVIEIVYRYPSKKVKLYVLNVNVQEDWLPLELKNSATHAVGRESQQCTWVDKDSLSNYRFPDANAAIIHAILLPTVMPISPGFKNLSELQDIVAGFNRQSFRLFHLRAPQLDASVLLDVLNKLSFSDVALKNHATINCSLAQFDKLPYGNLHLNSAELKKLATSGERLTTSGWLSASCHSLEELAAAEAVGVDYVFFSPVQATASHPDTHGRGWGSLEAFCAEASVPVYALGGMCRADIAKAIECGAQGIAGIGAFQRATE